MTAARSGLSPENARMPPGAPEVTQIPEPRTSDRMCQSVTRLKKTLSVNRSLRPSDPLDPNSAPIGLLPSSCTFSPTRRFIPRSTVRRHLQRGARSTARLCFILGTSPSARSRPAGIPTTEIFTLGRNSHRCRLCAQLRTIRVARETTRSAITDESAPQQIAAINGVFLPLGSTTSASMIVV
jgi:hypothetical protein